MSTTTLSHLRVDLEWTIEARREQVWEALTHEIDQWWPREFHVTEGATFRLQSEIGGRLFEDLGKGRGFVWFHITGFLPPEKLLLRGEIAPPYGGPATTLVTWELIAQGEGTVMRLTDCLFGALDEKQRSAVEEGWQLIFGERFVKHFEK